MEVVVVASRLRGTVVEAPLLQRRPPVRLQAASAGDATSAGRGRRGRAPVATALFGHRPSAEAISGEARTIEMAHCPVPLDDARDGDMVLNTLPINSTYRRVVRSLGTRVRPGMRHMPAPAAAPHTYNQDRVARGRVAWLCGRRESEDRLTRWLGKPLASALSRDRECNCVLPSKGIRFKAAATVVHGITDHARSHGVPWSSAFNLASS